MGASIAKPTGADDRQVRQIVRFVRTELAHAADPAKAGPMAAYMKTSMPFYGVQKPARERIERARRKMFPITDRPTYVAAVSALWALEHREEKYLAIAVARAHDDFITLGSMPLYVRMVRQGAWWDFVDEIAIRLVGRITLRARPAMTPKLRRFTEHRDMWVRRTALLAQITHKEETDADLLFELCLRCAHEDEFFIRKAIGWALREYAHTDPARVRRFLKEYGSYFSGLSIREASKHL